MKGNASSKELYYSMARTSLIMKYIPFTFGYKCHEFSCRVPSSITGTKNGFYQRVPASREFQLSSELNRGDSCRAVGAIRGCKGAGEAAIMRARFFRLADMVKNMLLEQAKED